MKPATVAIIQAHVGSTRLPNKVLMDIHGKPMLSRVVERIKQAKLIREVVVAIPTNSSDDPLMRLCRANGWACFRGSEDDVLDRYLQAALTFRADIVVRITSDCPLIDPALADQAIQVLLDGFPRLDYVSNNIPSRTFPLGLDVEVMQIAALEKAWHEDRTPSWREHVTLYILRHPELFRMKGVSSEVNYSDMRWTVDTVEDIEFVRHVFDYFGSDSFFWRDVIRAIEKHPDWLEINRHVKQKPEPE